MILLTVVMTAQEKLSFNVYMDPTLLLIGDDHGNDPGTLDILLKLEMQGNQYQYGYIYVYPQFEYADLEGGQYMRWAAGIGYTFNTIFKRLEASPQVNFGALQRPIGTSFSWEFGADLTYKLTKRLKLSALLTYTQRQDLDFMWNLNNEWRINGYLGVKMILN